MNIKVAAFTVSEKSFNTIYIFQTPVIHALGVVFKDEKVWTDPDK